MPLNSVAPVFETLVPRQDATARLLLLLAREDLSEHQKVEARTLAAEIRDWDEFAEIASKKFVITFVHRHLSSCAKDLVPAETMQNMKAQARASALSTLKIVSAQIAFHKRCIAPLNASYAYIKGSTLARQFLRNFGDRPGRDIDVLIADADFGAVLESALSCGYRIHYDGRIRTLDEGLRELPFLSRYADVVSIIGDEFIPIEIHRRLDKLSLNFDLKRLISTAETVTLAGTPLKTLSGPHHFVYVAYHHSRHFWSSLHWVADIEAMLRSPRCDREEIRAIADDIGIRPTVEAAFEFRDLLARPGLWGASVPLETGGGQFLKACLLNLDQNLDFEKQLRVGMPFSDFMSAWQISPGRHNDLWANTWRRRLRPSVSQYLDRPYPPPLYWVYSLTNLLELAGNALLRTLGVGKHRSNPPGREASFAPPADRPNGTPT